MSGIFIKILLRTSSDERAGQNAPYSTPHSDSARIISPSEMFSLPSISMLQRNIDDSDSSVMHSPQNMQNIQRLFIALLIFFPPLEAISFTSQPFLPFCTLNFG